MIDSEYLGSLDLRPAALATRPGQNLRIGMVGLGRSVMNLILPAYRAGGLNVVAGCDPDPAARERARSRWGVEQVFESCEEMLETVGLHVVDINLRWDRGCSPLRIEAVAQAAARGIHVLLAKPMAEHYEQCAEMVAEASRAGIKLAVNQNSRFAPSFFACRRLIEFGLIGPLLSAAISYRAARGIQRTPEFDSVHDMTVHNVDVLLSWFDAEPELVFAHETRRTSIGSVFTATLAFPDGSSGTIRDDFSTQHLRDWIYAAVGERGAVDGCEDIEVLEAGQPRMRRATLRYGAHVDGGVAADIPLLYRTNPDAFLATMGDLLRAVTTGGEPWASGESALRTMRTLFALKESARSRKPVAPAAMSAGRV